MPKNTPRPIVVLLLLALLLTACAPAPGQGVSPVPATLATLPVATTTTARLATLSVASPTTATAGATITVGPENSATATGPSAATATTAPATIASTRAAGLMPDLDINGCPEQQAPTATGTKADVVVGTNGSAGTGLVTMATGQVLEVRLGAVVHWTLVSQDPKGVLLPAIHNGWYDAGAQECVWRFTAQTSGTVSLAYSGRSICTAGKLCPQFVLHSDFAVTVQG